MRISVEQWAPEYGAGLDLGSPDELSIENVRVDCELDPNDWKPISPDPTLRPDAPVAFVDGTRRVDARIYVSDNGSAPTPGLAGSVGVGAVVCEEAGDGSRKRAVIHELRVTRHLVVGGGTAADLSAAGGLDYRSLPVPWTEMDRLVDALHHEMQNSETHLSRELANDGFLVINDGPLAVFDPGPQPIIGYIKAHARRYLPPEQETVLGKLGCGERTPVFAFGEKRPRYSWYVRLCAPEAGMHAWYGIARCEVPAALAVEQAIALADLSAVLLPPYASIPLWDKRAPQNLVPIAGLEKKMRHLLGDRELVYRMIRSAAMRGEVHV
jgi:hypothetical protein